MKLHPKADLRPLAVIAALVLVLASGCGGSGGDTGANDAAPSVVSEGGDVVLPKFCDLLSAEEIGTALGAEVTVETGPFDACEFAQEDPRALGGMLGATDVSIGNGGYEAYKSGAGIAMDDPQVHDLDGLGDGAFITTGTVMGGDNLQVAGGVLVGKVVYTLNLSQGVGLGEDELVTTGQKLLALMVGAD